MSTVSWYLKQAECRKYQITFQMKYYDSAFIKTHLLNFFILSVTLSVGITASKLDIFYAKNNLTYYPEQ
jgi:hypothetical protein